MQYINILFLTLFLAGCATSNTSSVSTPAGVISSTPSESDIHRYKTALSLLNSNKLDDAKEILSQITSERPEFAGPYANLAVIALKQDKSEEALEFVNIALSKNPQLSQALNLLGFIEQKNGDISSALKHYKQAIAINEEYANAHYNIALLYDIYMQDINNALTHYQKYLALIDHKDQSTVDWVEHLKQSRTKG